MEEEGGNLKTRKIRKGETTRYGERTGKVKGNGKGERGGN